MYLPRQVLESLANHRPTSKQSLQEHPEGSLKQSLQEHPEHPVSQLKLLTPHKQVLSLNWMNLGLGLGQEPYIVPFRHLPPLRLPARR